MPGFSYFGQLLRAFLKNSCLIKNVCYQDVSTIQQHRVMEEFTVFLLLAEKTIKTIIFRCFRGYGYGYASACPDKRRYSFRRLAWTWWWYWWIGGLPEVFYTIFMVKIFRRTFSSYPALIKLTFTHAATLLVKNVFFKKGVLTNFVKFTGKHLCQSLF